MHPLTPDNTPPETGVNFTILAKNIRQWAVELGFQQVGITDIDLSDYESRLKQWLDKGYAGEMQYMSSHGLKRSRANLLVPDTIRVISVRMDYLTQDVNQCLARINKSEQATISDYAIGRDYHKLIRKRLQQLAKHIEQEIGKFGYRVFCDSAPVLEKPLAEKSGLGWIGKHTNLINKQAGSWFFLGEIYTDLPLEVNEPAQTNSRDNSQSNSQSHCGTCDDCIQACPTGAIVAPYQLDARKCISYLTIELKGSIPEKLRPMIGNRIYGCDDCQLVCPWNRFARQSVEKDFKARHSLDNISLLECFSWTESEFEKRTEGSAIRRIGYEQWLRNVAVALGNINTQKISAASLEKTRSALQDKTTHDSELVREHVAWALHRLNNPTVI